MRIEKDLQSAIRAAAMAKKDRSYEIRAAKVGEAIRALLRRKPAIAERIKREAKLAAKCYAEYTKHRNAADVYGLNEKLTRIEDSGLFRKAGGELPQEDWTFNSVMAELIVAQPKELHRILAKYGINWK